MRGTLGRKFINLCFSFSNLKRSIPINAPISSHLYPQQQVQQYEEDDVNQYFSTILVPAAATDQIANILSSPRLFVPCPGRSSSIMESNNSSLYMDFRRSMEEVVEARNLFDVSSNSNWEYLHELLLCYLVLNPKTTHKFIHLAFSDLLHTLANSSITTFEEE